MAVYSCNDGLVAPVHGDGDAAAAVTVEFGGCRDALGGGEVHSCAEHLVLGVGGGENDGFDAWVTGEEVEDGDEVVSHDVGEAIAVGWAVEFDYDDGGRRRGAWWVMRD